MPNLEDLALAFLRQTPDLVLLLDEQLHIRAANPAFELATGISASRCRGQALAALNPFGHATQDLLAPARQTFVGGRRRQLDLSWIGIDGNELVHDCQLSALRKADGCTQATMLVARDVTTRRAAEQALASQGREFRSLADNLPDPVARYDRTGRLLYGNPALAAAIGLPPDTRIDDTDHEMSNALREQGIYAQVFEAVQRTLDEARSHNVELRFPAPSEQGGDRVHHIHVVPEFDAHGRCISALALGRDFTDIAQYQARVHQLASTDHLTGLLNRLGLTEKGPPLLQRAAARGAQAGVFLLDLDGFKAVNDRFGHAEGDRVLRDTAQRLRGAVREDDLVARLGGDEFVIMLMDTDGGSVLAHVMQRLHLLLATLPAPTDATDWPAVSASIGLARCPVDGNDLETLLHAADGAMYHHKLQRQRLRLAAG